MTERISVLFLCTGNSARSILAEYLLKTLAEGRVLSFSAGSQPTGKPNPFALETLALHNIDAHDARSKSWDEFTRTDAPQIDIVITVCDSAASEACPVWPGHPLTAHWGVEDPAAIVGTDDEKRLAFARTFKQMQRRIEALLALDLATRDVDFLKKLRAIGQIDDVDA